MWKISLTLTVLSLSLATVEADYITDSNEVGVYHYPAPPRSQRFYDDSTGQHFVNHAPQVYQNQYQGNYHAPAFLQQSSVITKQFASPALDNAAFNLALTNQGYSYGNAQGVNAALRSSKTNLQSAASSPSSSAIGSLNVKLPLPLGVTPLNIAPLPLQAGTPYANIPNGINSYGTTYPQRKRR